MCTDLKVLKDATHLEVEAQHACLARIKKEGADAKKAQQKVINAKRSAPKNPAHAKPQVEAAQESPSRSKPSFGDFIGAKLVA